MLKIAIRRSYHERILIRHKPCEKNVLEHRQYSTKHHCKEGLYVKNAEAFLKNVLIRKE